MTNPSHAITLRAVDSLYLHEETKPARLETVLAQVRREQVVDLPILVDRATGVIIDGHHRYAALRILGARLAPVVELDYLSDEVTLTVRPESGQGDLSKKDVLAKGLSGDVYPHKTTKHLFAFDKAAFPPTPLGRLL